MSIDAAAPSGPRRVWLARLLLPVVVFAHVALTGWWMSWNGFFARPLSSDGAWRRLEALPMLQALQHDGIIAWLRAGLAHDRPHPPLMMLVGALFSAPAGDLTPWTCWLAIAFFSLLLGFGAYALARRFGSAWFALAVTAVAGCAPAVALNMRAFYPQGPMTGVAVWCLWALLKSERFQRTGWSAFFGVCMGLATLTKMLAPLYVIGGVLVAVIPALVAAATRRRAAWNLAHATLIALALCAPWYVPHWGRVWDYLHEVVGVAGQASFSAALPTWAAERWAYYPLALVNEGLLLPLALLVTLAVVRLAFVRPTRDGGILGGAVLLSYPILTLGQVAGQSYYLSLWPCVLAIALCAVVRDLANRRLRHVAIAVTVLACAFNQWWLQRPFDVDRRAPAVAPIGPFEPVPTFACVLCPTQAFEVGARARREGEPWPVDEIAQLILASPPRAIPRVAIWMADPKYFHPYIDFPVVEYAAERMGRQLAWVQLDRLLPADHAPTPAELRAIMAGIDFVVVDHRATLTPDYCRGVAAAAGVTIEQLLLQQVTPQSLVGLYRLQQR